MGQDAPGMHVRVCVSAVTLRELQPSVGEIREKGDRTDM
jgi:hypothetical protein